MPGCNSYYELVEPVSRTRLLCHDGGINACPLESTASICALISEANPFINSCIRVGIVAIRLPLASLLDEDVVEYSKRILFEPVAAGITIFACS